MRSPIVQSTPGKFANISKSDRPVSPFQPFRLWGQRKELSISRKRVEDFAPHTTSTTRAKYFWMKERWIFKADGCMRRSNQSKYGRLNYKI